MNCSLAFSSSIRLESRSFASFTKLVAVKRIYEYMLFFSCRYSSAVIRTTTYTAFRNIYFLSFRVDLKVISKISKEGFKVLV